METDHSAVSLLEPAVYRICIQGILDKNWSDYCGGMTIEHESDPKPYAMTILTGRLADQSALIGVLNWLLDLGCPILAVECKEAGEMLILLDLLNDTGEKIEHVQEYGETVDGSEH
ncbi:MAG TPA: hypothetical protein VF026_05130 [Ktedonobacteraceae bacterium]